MPGIDIDGNVSISLIEKLFPRGKTVAMEKRRWRFQNRGRANETERRTNSKLMDAERQRGNLSITWRSINVFKQRIEWA